MERFSDEEIEYLLEHPQKGQPLIGDRMVNFEILTEQIESDNRQAEIDDWYRAHGFDPYAYLKKVESYVIAFSLSVAFVIILLVILQLGWI